MRTNFPSIIGLVFFTVAMMLIVAPVSVMAKPVTLVAFGDSLTAGLGVGPTMSFPARLEVALRAKGHDVTVQNAGVSGDTTSAGLDRLDWAIGDDASAVIVALGANDALRGLPPLETKKNLAAIVARITARGLPVLVAGMLAPRNLGAEYAASYDPVFGQIAAEYDALYYPFFLEGVAAVPGLNQHDGLHPSPEGVNVIVRKILPLVEALIGRVKK